MTDVRWHEHRDDDAMADAVASAVDRLIRQALGERGAAIIALPGGRSPRAAFDRLAQAKLDWSRVTIIPGDDRFVAADSPLSNVALLTQHFMPLGARIEPLVAAAAADYRVAGTAAAARLAELPWPLDLVWLGMGADGHTASIFPGPDYDRALNAPPEIRAVGVLPDPLPSDAPVARVTLTRGAIAAARVLLLTLSGDAKRKVAKQAIAEGDASPYPVGRVLSATEHPVHLHWSPE